MKHLFATLLAVVSLQLFAQGKPTEIVVTFAAGGTASNLAHLASEALNDKGRKTYVINKPGADSTIGANYVAESVPDGTVLLTGAGSSLGANLAFNTPSAKYNEKTFVPVIPLGTIGWTLYIQGSSDIKTYDQFKTYVKANPEKFTIAFWNTNYSKLLLAWAEKEGLPRPTIAMYKGGTPAMADVAGGHVLVGVLDLQATMGLYQGNKINILAAFDTGTQERVVKVHGNKAVVDITKIHPTLNFSSWWAIWAPAATPAADIRQINTTINAAFKEPKFRNKIDQMIVNNVGGTPEETLAWQQRDLKILREVAAKYK